MSQSQNILKAIPLDLEPINPKTLSHFWWFHFWSCKGCWICDCVKMVGCESIAELQVKIVKSCYETKHTGKCSGSAIHTECPNAGARARTTSAGARQIGKSLDHEFTSQSILGISSFSVPSPEWSSHWYKWLWTKYKSQVPTIQNYQFSFGPFWQAKETGRNGHQPKCWHLFTCPKPVLISSFTRLLNTIKHHQTVFQDFSE